MALSSAFDLAYGPLTIAQLGYKSPLDKVSVMRGPLPVSVQVGDDGVSATLPANKRLFYGIKLPGAIKGNWLVKTELTQPAGSAPTAPYTGKHLLNNPAVRTAMHAEPSDPTPAVLVLACLAEIFYTDADGESNAVPGQNFDFVINAPLVNNTESINQSPGVLNPRSEQVPINLGAGPTPVTKRTGAAGDAAALSNVVTVGRALGTLFTFKEAATGNVERHFDLQPGAATVGNPDHVAPADFHAVNNPVHFARVSIDASVPPYQITTTSGTVTLPVGTRRAVLAVNLSGNLTVVFPLSGGYSTGEELVLEDVYGASLGHVVSVLPQVGDEVMGAGAGDDPTPLWLAADPATKVARFLALSGGEWHLVATPAGGDATITTPRIAYVETTGNNATAVLGDRSKPYQTFAAAYTAALDASVVPGGYANVGIKFGAGNFTLTLAQNLNTRISYYGAGSQLTRLFINLRGASGTDQENSDEGNIDPTPGGNGYGTYNLYASNLYLSIDVSGGRGGVYQDEPQQPGGNAGTVVAYFGEDVVAEITGKPGHGSYDGGAAALSLHGGAVSIDMAAPGGSIGGSFGYVSLSNVRLVSLMAGDGNLNYPELVFARCDLTNGFPGDSFTDLGGNAFD